MGYKKESCVSQIAQSEAIVNALRMGDWMECEQLCMKIYHEYIWNPCYEEVIEECWNKFHGMYCGLLMVKYMKEDVLQGYMDEFSNLQLSCLVITRFQNRPWIRYDMERVRRELSKNQVLSVKEQEEERLSSEDVEELLYRWIGTLVCECKRVNRPVKNVFNTWDSEKYDVRCAVGVRQIICLMQSLKHWNLMVNFNKWADRVVHQYKEIATLDVQKNWTNFLQVITEEFPVWCKNYVCTEYYDYSTPAQLNLTQIIQTNPNVGKLVEALQLKSVSED